MKRNEELKRERKYVHYEPDGTETVKDETDFTPEELAAIHKQLADRFYGELGFEYTGDRAPA